MNGLPETDRTWTRLHAPGILKKVNLLPPEGQVVQVVDTPVDLGK